MKPIPSRSFLTELLANAPTADEVEQFVAANQREDQWFDYKAGALLEDRKNAIRELQIAVSGFANIEGGFVVLGYHQQSGKFDGAKAPGGGNLTDWLVRILGSLVGLPPPRFSSVVVEGAEVVVIAVDRSERLVPVPEDGDFGYYGRFGDQTLRMPQQLVIDLMLGRRVRPDLRFDVTAATWGGRIDAIPHLNVLGRRLTVSFALENAGLVSADECRFGLVMWALPEFSLTPAWASLGRNLEAALPKMQHHGIDRWELGHVRGGGSALTLAPLERHDTLTLTLPVLLLTDTLGTSSFQSREPTHGSSHAGSQSSRERYRDMRRQLAGRIRASGAVYVVGRFEPQWFQLTVDSDGSSPNLKGEYLRQRIRIEPVHGQRPRVAIDFLPLPDESPTTPS